MERVGKAKIEDNCVISGRAVPRVIYRMIEKT